MTYGSARILGTTDVDPPLQGGRSGALADARAALEKAEQVDDPTLVVTTIARLAQAEGWGGDVTPGLLERGVEIEERLGSSSTTARAPGLLAPPAYAERRARSSAHDAGGGGSELQQQAATSSLARMPFGI